MDNVGKKKGKFVDMTQIFADRAHAEILKSEQRIEQNLALVKNAEAQVISIISSTLKRVVTAKIETAQGVKAGVLMSQQIHQPQIKVLKTTLTLDCNDPANTGHNGDFYEYPASKDLSFDKHIVGFACNGTSWDGVIPIFSDGTRANLKQESENSGSNWKDVTIP